MGIDWLMGLALLAGGGVIGVLLGRLIGSGGGREKQLTEELEQTREELKSYRSSVESHFRETAEAVNEMTESYRRVHEKLRAGAEQLCSDSGPLLELRTAPRLERQNSDTAQERQAAATPPAPSTPESDATQEAPEAATPDEPSPAPEGASDTDTAEPRPEPEQAADDTQGEPEPVADDSQGEPEPTVDTARPADPDQEEKTAEAGAAETAGESEEPDGAAVTQPLDYAVNEEEREKTIH